MAYMLEVLCSTADIFAQLLIIISHNTTYEDSIYVNFLTVSPPQSSTMWMVFHLGWQYKQPITLGGSTLAWHWGGQEWAILNKRLEGMWLKMFDKDYWKDYMCEKHIFCTVVNKIIKRDNQHQLFIPPQQIMVHS